MELIARLITAGVKDIEVASFVSPKAVPAMAGAAEVVAATRDLTSHLDVTLWALVPNVKGAELATAAGVDHLTITISASPAYSEKNVNMTIAQAFEQVAAIRAAAPDAVLDAVISCCFGSPFDGEQITPDDVAALVDRARDRRRRPGDPRRHHRDGDAAPRARGARAPPAATSACTSTTPAARRCSTPGRRSRLGVDRFDTALGGLGGSPFAPTAGGNLATEDLVMVLADAGIDTGIDLDALLDAGPLLAELVGHDAPEPRRATRQERSSAARRGACGRLPTTPGRPPPSVASRRNRASTTSTT